jgi:AmmeMemoRadiSam system protein A
MDEANRKALLQIARDRIAAELARTSWVEPSLTGELCRPAGAFVTLHRGGQLRGCIGQIEADEPLGQVVARCAAAACRNDPRFAPVTFGELEELDIELSVLGPLERLVHLDEIVIGRHGLVVELGRRRGLLLPQVASEWHWDRLTFVEQTCRKAGLSTDAWKKNAVLWKFEAEVFSEGLTARTSVPESGRRRPLESSR